MCVHLVTNIDLMQNLQPMKLHDHITHTDPSTQQKGPRHSPIGQAPLFGGVAAAEKDRFEAPLLLDPRHDLGPGQTLRPLPRLWRRHPSVGIVLPHRSQAHQFDWGGGQFSGPKTAHDNC